MKYPPPSKKSHSAGVSTYHAGILCPVRKWSARTGFMQVCQYVISLLSLPYGRQRKEAELVSSASKQRNIYRMTSMLGRDRSQHDEDVILSNFSQPPASRLIVFYGRSSFPLRKRVRQGRQAYQTSFRAPPFTKAWKACALLL